ncbi:hypothetical protein D1AOALGA4SA_8896 [Olavius algarvensis Delta 1 endosymbiont]|nr:hypothetical protein D1AOALGA4SA_8896 [Olavius algarvensis Delta 1 endosymbiont]
MTNHRKYENSSALIMNQRPVFIFISDFSRLDNDPDTDRCRVWVFFNR